MALCCFAFEAWRPGRLKARAAVKSTATHRVHTASLLFISETFNTAITANVLFHTLYILQRQLTPGECKQHHQLCKKPLPTLHGEIRWCAHVRPSSSFSSLCFNHRAGRFSWPENQRAHRVSDGRGRVRLLNGRSQHESNARLLGKLWENWTPGATSRQECQRGTDLFSHFVFDVSVLRFIIVINSPLQNTLFKVASKKNNKNKTKKNYLHCTSHGWLLVHWKYKKNFACTVEHVAWPLIHLHRFTVRIFF